MRMRRLWLICWVGVATFSAPSVWAGFEISTDNRSLFFGLMHLGEEKTLSQFGNYHNQVTCTSTNGRSWNLKISVLHPLTSGRDNIPLEAFQWQMVSTNGKGTIPKLYQFSPFSLVPTLVYISHTDETAGSSIQFNFKYELKIPESQAAGAYQTTIRFTLTEIL
ncbi:MAG: hypothetical protein HYT88_02910 [Candidatus Omnitrophica bacterium]|nr:hypothetical protein [Candidatus Omnitrophota bacterium]